jgi:hypothetical protein
MIEEASKDNAALLQSSFSAYDECSGKSNILYKPENIIKVIIFV